MTDLPEPTITVHLDVANPGQFFACCGLLELADRLRPGAEGWFRASEFHIASPSPVTLADLLNPLLQSEIANTMSPDQLDRLQQLSVMTKKQRRDLAGAEEEKKSLEALRRKEPVVLRGAFPFCIDWFCDEDAGGSRFKTWAGQQSVLDIALAMQKGMSFEGAELEANLWARARGIGLPFNFDSDLGGQGSALDIGFSFDPLASSEATRIEGACKPALELLCFLGLQRFRPRELPRENRYIYAAWTSPLSPSVAAAAVSQAIRIADVPCYEFRLLYRTKYLKSFLPAIPFRGDRSE